jgi:hypothetical protein
VLVALHSLVFVRFGKRSRRRSACRSSRRRRPFYFSSRTKNWLPAAMLAAKRLDDAFLVPPLGPMRKLRLAGRLETILSICYIFWEREREGNIAAASCLAGPVRRRLCLPKLHSRSRLYYMLSLSFSLSLSLLTRMKERERERERVAAKAATQASYV